MGAVLGGEERLSSHSAEYTDFGDEKQTERGISSHRGDLSRSSLKCAAAHRALVPFNVILKTVLKCSTQISLPFD